MDLIAQIAAELKLHPTSVAAVVALLEEGNTIPFIARYRKEATGNLDEVQIRSIQERLAYLNELNERKQTILKSIEEQGKLTAELRQQIQACEVKSALEDLYLPYKPKRRTRATIAREKGLEALAVLIREQALQGSPVDAAQDFVDAEKGVEDVEAALAGARDIMAEWIAEDADVRGYVRDCFMEQGVVCSTVCEDKRGQSSKFEQYYEFNERAKTIPSHRYLAIRRGEKEGFLDFSIELDPAPVLDRIEGMLGLKAASPWSDQLRQAIQDSYRRLISSAVETDTRVELKLRSDGAAVAIFADNLQNLLMAAPAGEHAVIGIDPGLRTGCKVAVIDATGKFLAHTTFFLTQGSQAMQRAQAELLALIEKFRPFALAVGNGTGNREAEAFARDTLALVGIKDVLLVQVNEAGASVYSASDVARDEFPDLDLTVRGAISIARRLQDPLAELVKIEPKSIGVGQYQHDVYQPMLAERLHDVVESCVNKVGVEVNTASASLLGYVAGIGASTAKKIVTHRDQHGAFKSRHELLKVAGLGPKTFEQAAGFLRLRAGQHPLDASAVHPERYALVEQIAADLKLDLKDLIGNAKFVEMIDIQRYEDASIGSYTLKDIVEELKKPGRDPRASFEPPKFREDIVKIDDLQVGMQLEGVVTNVTAFGAFVDVGVHQDGLVHVSELSDSFVQDPSEVVSTGQRIKVRVQEVDVGRKRISLSAKQENSARPAGKAKKAPKPTKQRALFATSPFADL
jgi:uncharacterized protein